MKPAILFDAVFLAAEKIGDPTARSILLAGLAKAQFAAENLDEAFRVVESIPLRAEQRGVLLHLALEAIDANETAHVMEIVRKMVKLDPSAAPVAGRLALSLVAKEEIDGAMRLLAVTENPFEGDRVRYEFIEKLAARNRIEEIEKLLPAFTDPDFADWARLILAKKLAEKNRVREADDIAQNFTSPEKQAWTLFEMSRNVQDEPEKNSLLRRAGEILESVSTTPQTSEKLSVELRIVGKALFQAGESERAERLLERSEAVSAGITTSAERFKARLLLAKVLKDLGIIENVRNYFDPSQIRKGILSPKDRSRAFQWLAEATSETIDWTESIRDAESEPDTTERARRLAEIVRRLPFTGRITTPSGQPETDSFRLSAEEFEEYYFSPFAIDGCHC